MAKMPDDAMKAEIPPHEHCYFCYGVIAVEEGIERWRMNVPALAPAGGLVVASRPVPICVPCRAKHIEAIEAARARSRIVVAAPSMRPHKE